jgi:hypothetical protein
VPTIFVVSATRWATAGEEGRERQGPEAYCATRREEGRLFTRGVLEAGLSCGLVQLYKNPDSQDSEQSSPERDGLPASSREDVEGKLEEILHPTVTGKLTQLELPPPQEECRQKV